MFNMKQKKSCVNQMMGTTYSDSKSESGSQRFVYPRHSLCISKEKCMPND